MGNVTTLDTGFIVLEHDLFAQTVDLATGYILPAALAGSPQLTIKPVIECLNLPFGDAYVETNDNSSHPIPAGSGSSKSLPCPMCAKWGLLIDHQAPPSQYLAPPAQRRRRKAPTRRAAPLVRRLPPAARACWRSGRACSSPLARPPSASCLVRSACYRRAGTQLSRRRTEMNMMHAFSCDSSAM